MVQFAKPGAADGSGKSGKSEPDAVAVSKVPATSLPLVVPRTNQRGAKSTVLVQADRQDEAIDLSGDVGAVGRLTTSSSGVILDLQGHRYAGNFVPCHSHLVVNLGMYFLCSSYQTTLSNLLQEQTKRKWSMSARSSYSSSTWRM